MEPLGEGDPRRVGPYDVVGRLEGELGREVSTGQRRLVVRAEGRARTVLAHVAPESVSEDVGRWLRFRAEAEQARRLGGRVPWLAPVEGVSGPYEAPPWSSGPFVPALSLPGALRVHGGPLPVGTVMASAVALAECLEGVHGAGYAHAGVFPENVLLTVAGPRLCGFGAVRVAAADGEDRSRAPGLVVEGVAPEQLAGGRPRPPGDVYGLGAVLAYAVLGRMPVGRDELPGAWRALLGPCLARDAADRPSAAELARRWRRSWESGEVTASRWDEGGDTSEGGEGNEGPELSARTVVLSRGGRVGGGTPTRAPRGECDGRSELDAQLSESQDAFDEERLPPRVAVALAEQAAMVLAAETDGDAGGVGADPEEPLGEGSSQPPVPEAGAVGTAEHGGETVRSGVRKRITASASRLGTLTTRAMPLGGGWRPQRRSLLYGAAGGVVGAALGAGGVMAFGSGGSAPPRRVRGSGEPPEARWSYELPGRSPRNAPRVWRGEKLLVENGSSVLALSVARGEEAWTARNVVPRESVLDVGRGLVMVPAAAPVFLAGENGEVRWKETGFGDSDVAVESVLGQRGGVVWLTGVRDERLVVLGYRVRDRKVLWVTPLPEQFGGGEGVGAQAPGPLLWDDGAVVVQEALFGIGDEVDSVRKRFVALRRADGEKLWTRKYEGVEGEVSAASLRSGYAVVFVDGELRALRLRDGEEEWATSVRSETSEFAAPVVDRGTVYTVDTGCVVTAVNARTGETRWRSDAQTLFSTLMGQSPRVGVSPSGETVVAALKDEVVALRGRDGRVLWRLVDSSGVADSGGPGRTLSFAKGTLVMLNNRSLYALPVA